MNYTMDSEGRAADLLGRLDVLGYVGYVFTICYMPHASGGSDHNATCSTQVPCSHKADAAPENDVLATNKGINKQCTAWLQLGALGPGRESC